MKLWASKLKEIFHFTSKNHDDLQDRLFNIILLVFLAFLLLLFFAPSGDSLTRKIATYLPMSIIVILIYALSRYGWWNLSRISFVLCHWVWLTVLIYYSGGINTPSTMGFLMLVLFTGIILNEGAALIIAILSILSNWGLWYIEIHGQLPSSSINWTIERVFFTNSVLILLIVPIGALTVLIIKAASARANDEFLSRKNVEKTLWDNKERLQMVLDGSNAGYWDWNTETGEANYNQRCAELLGYDLSEIPPRISSFIKIVYPDDVKYVRKAFFTGIVEPSGFLFECRMRHKSGQWNWIQIRGKVFSYKKNNKPLQLAGVMIDITERKTEQESLRQSKADLIEAQKIAHVGSWSYDSNSQQVYRSEETKRIYGFDDPVAQINVSEYYDFVHPDDIPLVKSIIDSIFKTGESTSVEHRIVTRDGKVKIVFENGYAKKDAKGRVTGIYGITMDITERKQYEQSLLDEKNRARSYLDIAGVMILAVDAEGYVTMINRKGCEILGLPEKDVVGVNWMQRFLPPNDPENSEVFFGETMQGHSPDIGEWENNIITGRGEIRRIKWHYSIMRDGAGNIIGTLNSGLDVTEQRKNELLLKESEERFQKTFLYAPTGVCLISPEGKILQVNKALQSMLGYSEKYLTENNYQQFVHPDDIESILKHIQRLIDGSLPTFGMEARLLHQLGEWIWVLMNVILVRNELGQPLNFIFQLQDISDQRRSIKALNESRQQLQLIMDAANDGIWDWSVPDGKIKYNPRYETMLGYIQGSLSHSFKSFMDMVHLEDQDVLRTTYQKVIEGQVDHYVVEYRMQCMDSSYLWILERGKVAQRDSSGKALRIVGTNTDITEQKATNDELKKLTKISFEESNVFLTEILNTLSAHIAVINEKGEIVFINESWKQFALGNGGDLAQVGLGVNYLEICQRSQAINEDDVDKVVQGLKDVIAGTRKIFSMEYPCHSPNDKRWFAMQAQVLSGLREKHVFISHENVTYQKAAEEALRQAREASEAASHAKSGFLANMSHEIRTPLNSILGFTQLLQKNKSLTEEQREHLDVIYKSGEHLLDLFNDILDMSKIDAGRVSLNEHRFDLWELLEKLGRYYKRKAANKKLSWSMDIGENVPRFIVADHEKLRKVLLNLLGNAIKFTDEGFVHLKITAVTGERGHWVLTFEVEDTGIGISEDEMKLLFKPFSQTQIGMESKGGTGLGLAISQQYVRVMKGEITVNSRPGKGSVFRFTLHVHESERKEVSGLLRKEKKSGVDRNIGLTGKIVLIIDDNPASREALRDALVSTEVLMVKSANVHEALELVKKNVLDIILMDISDPGMEDRLAIQTIRELRTEKNIPIIIVTVDADENECKKYCEAGASDCLNKPFSIQSLLKLMITCLKLNSEFIRNDEKINDSSQHSNGESIRGELDSEWMISLQEAVLAADIDRVYSLIEILRPEHPRIAGILRKHAERFDYEGLLNCFENWRNESHE